MSFDAPAANAKWRDKKGFTFELWTDASRTLAMAMGAATSKDARAASRVTRLLDAEGNVIVEYTVRGVGTHPAEVLEDAKTLLSGK